MPKAFHLENNPSIQDEELKKILSTSPDLECLRIKACPSLSEHALACMISCPIRFLEWIENSNISSRGFQALQELRKTLLSLNVSGCQGFNEEACQAIVRSCPKLRSLDVSFCPLGPSAFKNTYSPIAFLNLEGCSNITDETIGDISQIPTLKHLFLAQNTKITEQGLAKLQSLSLSTLSIRGRNTWKLSDNCV